MGRPQFNSGDANSALRNDGTGFQTSHAQHTVAVIFQLLDEDRTPSSFHALTLLGTTFVALIGAFSRTSACYAAQSSTVCK